MRTNYIEEKIDNTQKNNELVIIRLSGLFLKLKRKELRKIDEEEVN